MALPAWLAEPSAENLPEGEFGRVAKSLLDAGSPRDALLYPRGDAGIDDVLQPRMRDQVDGAALLGDDPAVTRLLGLIPDPAELALALAGAAKGGPCGLCRGLPRSGASIESRTHFGYTPLEVARGHFRLAARRRILAEMGSIWRSLRERLRC